jgi:osmotically inducible protein OsmC
MADTKTVERKEGVKVRKANATWQGDLKAGTGTINSTSGAFANMAYSFGTRFEDKPGTNPEELIAAAHAACFSMALSADLGRAGFNAERIDSTAEVSLGKVDGKPTVTASHLTTRARVPGIDRATFDKIANETKAGCPISRLLKAEITLDATLEN